MIISAIVAMSENGVIGKNNQLPWHLPADLKHFKTVTLGKPILMGRKTFQSIGKALPGRRNVVITHDTNFQAPGCVVAHSLEGAITAVADSEEIFIIGGALLYKQMLPKIQRLYLTIVNQEMTGDAYFPDLDCSDWNEIERVAYPADLYNQYSFSFVILERKI